MRRLLSMVVPALWLSATALFASGGSETTASVGPGSNFNPSGFPIVKDKITVNLLYPRQAIQGDWNDMLLFKELEKLTNIKMAATSVPSDSYQEKKNLLFASGDLPDLFWEGITKRDEYLYGVQGKVLQPYNDLIEKYGPNLKKTMASYPGLKAKITATDGNIYALPYAYDDPTIAGVTMYIRMDWLSQAGSQKPTNTTEFYNVLKAFQTLYPTLYPMSLTWNVLKAYMVTAFGPLNNPWYDRDANGKVVIVPATDQYREMLRYLNKLYSEKLLDNEVFTQQTQDLIAKVKENRVGLMNFGTLLLPSNFKSGNYEVEMVVPLTSEFVSKPKNEAPSKVALGYGAITNKNKYPEATMRWLDDGYSDDDVAPGINRLSYWLGIRGVSWDYTAADKTKYKRIIPSDTKYSEVEYMMQVVAPGWGPCNLQFIGVPDGSTSQLMKATQSIKNFFPYNQPEFPFAYLRYTPDEQEKVNALQTDLETYVKSMEAKFVSGTESFSNWDAYLANLKKIGVDELTKIFQAAYDRYLKSS